MHDLLIKQGFTLMLAGMGTVFVFLTALVLAMTLMSAFTRRFQQTENSIGNEELAAIAAAIDKHRRR